MELGMEEKGPEMIKRSLLPTNEDLLGRERWDEAAILNRCEELFKHVAYIWCQ
jgi:hypothetical protein